MCRSTPGGFTGQILRVDLTKGLTSVQDLSEDSMRSYMGGTGLGARVLYEEVPPGVEWSDPKNRLILASGPLGGTKVSGSGTFSAVTKGALTNGAAASQANGFFGAYIKFCGFDGIVLQGAANKLSYLHISDGAAEIRDASHLAGKDTWETEDIIKEELGQAEHQISVFSIGPAGENLVRFAAMVGDRGHVVAHNGVGAVLGSKRLKAIAVTRGRGKVAVKDKMRFSDVAKYLVERVKTDPVLKERVYKWGTLDIYERMEKRSLVPIKNYTTNIFPDKARLANFTAPYIRGLFEKQPHPCWACHMHHCHIYKVTEVPFAGRMIEEPEYEGIAAWSGQIGQTDVVKAILLSDEVDRLGMDWNDSSWLIGFLMECYEKGLITKENTDGIEMTWGNVEAVRKMLYKIASRQGLGDLLAEGTMRYARYLGGEALKLAIYTEKGNTPRSHDHRVNWHQLFDTCVSDTGTIESGPAPELQPAEMADLHLSPAIPPFSWKEAATSVAKLKGIQLFEDSMGTCRFTTLMGMKNLAELVAAATGWQFTLHEAMEVGERIANLLRVFNIRHGISGDADMPSLRYGSTPLDGIAVGRSIMPFWEQMLQLHHKLLGWDEKTGKPLPDTLKRLGLEYTIPHIW